jgi:hypothetical protein
LFLRFYKLSALFHWTLDEEFWSYVPYNIATGYHFPLIGGHISGTGLYSGPMFVWLMAVPFFLFGGNPIGIAVFVSLLGVLTTTAVFLVGKVLFGRKAALIASLVSASSFLMTIYDRKYWNASAIPLLSLLIMWCIAKIAKGQRRWAFLLASVLALAFHAHMTSGALLLFVIISWIVLRLPIRKKEILLAIGLFLLLQVPLLAFELRHEFINSKALVNLVSRPHETTSFSIAAVDVARLALNTAGRLLYAPAGLDIANELTLCTQYATRRFRPPIWSILLALVALWNLFRERKRPGVKLLLMLFGANLLGLVWYRMRAAPGNWYQGQLSEYFFFPSYPGVFLSLGLLAEDWMRRLGKRAWAIKIGLAGLLLVNVLALLSSKHTDGYSLKRSIVEKIANDLGDNEFTLSVEGNDPCRIYGYRYLFSVLGKEPASSYLDPQFGWLYEKRRSQEEAQISVQIEYKSGSIDYSIE